MIQAVSHVQLGASLWLRCLSLQLAERWNYGHSVLALPGFPTITADVKSRRLFGPRLRLEGQWPRDAYSGRNLTPQELKLPPEACVVLAGEFQRFELIAEVRDKVREDWLRLENPLPVRAAGELLIGVREGEQVMEEAEVRALTAKARGQVHFADGC